MEQPIVAITIGDANGIGPEIVAKVLAREAVHERCRPLIVGDVRVMREIEAVRMYHDQANIARKLQPMSAGATVFMGLPVACATTAHGTAFDKAGLGIADPGSLAAALDYTIRLSPYDHWLVESASI
jgi:4-hydroxy-L-threonine phosphate dehydrogenase PdxA